MTTTIKKPIPIGYTAEELSEFAQRLQRQAQYCDDLKPIIAAAQVLAVKYETTYKRIPGDAARENAVVSLPVLTKSG